MKCTSPSRIVVRPRRAAPSETAAESGVVAQPDEHEAAVVGRVALRPRTGAAAGGCGPARTRRRRRQRLPRTETPIASRAVERRRLRQSQGRFPFALANLPRLQRQLGGKPLELARILRRVHAVLQQLQPFDPPLQIAALDIERAQLRIGRQRLGRSRAHASGSTATRPSLPSAAGVCAAFFSPLSSRIGCSVSMMPSRSYARRPRRFANVEGLEHRRSRPFLSASASFPASASTKYPPKSVANRSAPFRVAATIVRPGAAQRLDERPARARRVHEHHVLRLQAFQQRREVLRRHVRSRQVELRYFPVERAVPDQEHEDDIVRGRLRRALRTP